MKNENINRWHRFYNIFFILSLYSFFTRFNFIFFFRVYYFRVFFFLWSSITVMVTTSFKRKKQSLLHTNLFLVLSAKRWYQVSLFIQKLTTLSINLPFTSCSSYSFLRSSSTCRLLLAPFCARRLQSI